MKPPASSRFAPNITTQGRVIRAAGATVLLVVGAFALQVHWAFAAALFLGSAFMFFEALRGWCALRACRIKTPF